MGRKLGILPFFLCALLCLLLTGCNSIIYNGDLKIKAYEPETLPDDYKTEINELASEELADEADAEKYNIDGVNAFYILPEHENNPDKIVDFKVLDYDEEIGFVYAYRTPYYGEVSALLEEDAGESVSEGGPLISESVSEDGPLISESVSEGGPLISESVSEGGPLISESVSEGGPLITQIESSGSSDSADFVPPEAKIAPEGFTPAKAVSTNIQVVVLMSYQPDKREYRVFFSAFIEGGDSVDFLENGVMAQKLLNEQAYFIYVNNAGYLFDSEGRQTWSYDYASLVNQEVERLKQLHSQKYNGNDYDVSTTVTDVVMDGNHYVYIPVTLLYEKKVTGEDLDSLETEDEEEEDQDPLETEDEELESASFRSIICCYQLDISDGNKNGIEFISENSNWEAQKKEWLEQDGREFESLEELKAYRENNTMDIIKNRSPDKGGDLYSVFFTKGSAVNMYLAGIPDVLGDIYGSKLIKWLYDNYDYFKDQGRNDLEYQLWRTVHFTLWFNLQKYWSNAKYEQFIDLAKTVMILRAQETDEGKYIPIPELAPGVWVPNGKWESLSDMEGQEWVSSMGEGNISPLSDNKLEALFAMRTTVYEDNTRVVRIANIEIPDRFENWLKYRSGAPRPRMEAVEYTEPLERTFKYKKEIIEEGKDSEGNAVSNTVEVICEYTERIPPMPKSYRISFPEGTKVFWLERLDTDEIIAPAPDFGALYYKDLSDAEKTDEESLSQILYRNGMNQAPLDDKKVKGKALDAGLLANGDTKIAAMFTTTGLTVWKSESDEKGGLTFPEDKKQYLSYENMERSQGLAISSGETSANTESEIEKARNNGELSQNVDISNSTSGEEIDYAKLEVTQVREAQNKAIDDSLQNGKASQNLNISSLTMMNEDEILISSNYDGILLYNIVSGFCIPLAEGSYFATFPLKKEKDTDDYYMVVGYDTADYSYQPSDISRAKCYRKNLGGKGTELKIEALKDYLKGISDGYLSRKHRLAANEAGKKTLAPETTEEKDADEWALKLFYDEDEQYSNLSKLLGKLGFPTSGKVSDEARAYVDEVRKTLSAQAAGLGELYELVGLGGIEAQEDADILELEGLAIQAAYTSSLESVMVRFALLDAAVDKIEDEEKQSRYRGYQDQKKALDFSAGEMSISPSWNKDPVSGDGLQSTQATFETAKDDLENMAFYQEILADLKETYGRGAYKKPEAGEGNQGKEPALGSGSKRGWEDYTDKEQDSLWDDYVWSLLKRISPDNAAKTQEESIQDFCDAVGISLEINNIETLTDVLSGIRRVLDLEEFIVEYKLGSALYQDCNYGEELQKFKDKKFKTEEERKEEFTEAGFYKIIEDTKESEAVREMLEDQHLDWEGYLESVIEACCSGLLLP